MRHNGGVRGEINNLDTIMLSEVGLIPEIQSGVRDGIST